MLAAYAVTGALPVIVKDEMMIPGIPKFALEMATMPWVIGHFVMEWSKHERMLAGLISILENRIYEDVRDELLDGQTNDYEARLQQASCVIPKDSPAIGLIEEILAMHVTLRDVRHDIIHGCFSGLNEDEEYVFLRKRRKQAQTARPLTSSAIFKRAKELASLGETVIDAGRVFQGECRIRDLPVVNASGS